MSGRGGGGGGRGNNGISAITAGARKMVQGVKEIVNYPEAEIYAMLKECNMDPNEAVNRLLSQDPFHEVKSKREKKKENKDTTDPRSRGASNATHRGGRGVADRYGRGGSSTQISSNDYGASLGKPAYRKENGTHAYAGISSSASNMQGINVNQVSPLQSDPVSTENKIPTLSAGNGVSSLSQPSGYQSVWLGALGQVSMADIVKMGRPHNKASAMPSHHSVNNWHDGATPVAESRHDLQFSENHSPKLTGLSTVPERSASQHVHSEDEWPSIEQRHAASMSSVLDIAADSQLHVDTSSLPLNRGNKHIRSEVDDGQSVEDGHVEALTGNHVGPASLSSKNVHEDGSGDSSLFDNSLYGEMNPYQAHTHAFEHDKAEDSPSSVAANLQHLNLENEDQGPSSEEDNPSVIIPNHLQVHAQDCSHLSFGSFGSGISSSLSASFASRLLKNNLDEPSLVVLPSTAHSDTRNPEYYGDEHLRNTPDENLVHRAAVSVGNFESPSVQQPEVLKEDNAEVSEGNRYAFPSSGPDFSYENTQQLNATFNNQETSSQMPNIAPFSSVMAYSNSLSDTLLASNVQSGREPDLPYSPFPVTQSMPTKYSNSPSSISGSSLSMPEALRAGSISTLQPTPQTLPGASVATGPALPQHLAVHPYSQPTLPLAHFANMISYPFLPQSYTYMPPAFQQAFAGNSAYQSLAAMLPQFKNSVSVSSLPQSGTVASAYGFGNSTNSPAGNFPLNPPTAPGGTTIGYEDVLNSQYKDTNHLISLQQNENSAMWVHGPGLRSMSAVPNSTYYSYQGQNQQPGGFRQGQQQSTQHLGSLGYPNYYHSQLGIPPEHQQQNSRDGSLVVSQVQPSKQTQQLWQNSY